MSARKPLHPDCKGGIFCPVEGHVVRKSHGWNLTVSHVLLTAGQRKTLRERRAQERSPGASRACDPISAVGSGVTS